MEVKDKVQQEAMVQATTNLLMIHTFQLITIINLNQLIQRQWVAKEVILLPTRQQEVDSLDKVKRKVIIEELEVTVEINSGTVLTNHMHMERTLMETQAPT